MKIYFGQAEQQDVEFFGGDDLFQAEGMSPNEYYYNYVEFGTNVGGLDEVVIVDSCGRIMPINCDHLEDLITALTRLQTMSQEIKYLNELEDMRNDALSDDTFVAAMGCVIPN